MHKLKFISNCVPVEPHDPRKAGLDVMCCPKGSRSSSALVRRSSCSRLLLFGTSSPEIDEQIQKQSDRSSSEAGGLIQVHKFIKLTNKSSSYNDEQSDAELIQFRK
ncbi:hypothetical protein BaRGS_00037907 [Batillaria attramentaria]|uniref:Uncharacterized protein n=1 Tax=Batillaria attramentaria TaxID=370345 RepID=A0ABD0J7B1_9CAEN